MPNINDVAKLAGVSVATVSRFIRSPEIVAPKSAAKVKQAISELNYTPNLLARNFSESRSYTVMVLVPDLTNPFLADLIHGIEKVGRQLGYQFILVEISPLEPEFESLLDKPETKAVDGIIQLFATLPQNYNASTPLVILSDCSDDASLPSVTIDDTAASYEMVNHLISLGHRRIACLKGSDFVQASSKRYEGYKNALKKAQIEDEIVIETAYTLSSGEEAANEFVKLDPRPTAVFCMSDTMAMGFMRGLRQHAIEVPEDVSVTGFDGIAFSKYTNPALTTIEQPATHLGATAMQTLLLLIKNPELAKAAQTIRLPWQLELRESTAPPKR